MVSFKNKILQRYFVTKTPKKLKVKLFSPYQIFFEGEAVSLSARNQTGPFDVLYDHINFFSLLEAGDIYINTGTDTRKIPIESGLIKISDNNIVLFANV
jgi:F0F1-type ATP synthase epsilon subunit